MAPVDAIIIGAGPSGIAMAHKLKQKLGFEDFTASLTDSTAGLLLMRVQIYEKLDGPGGTWRTNVYPGCGCDIPTHLYSFSFNLNPTWSKELCDREEILEYMESTVDKFHLRPHMVFDTSCEGATWNQKENKWEVHLVDEKTKRRYTKQATIFISAIGSIAEPRRSKFPGQDEFKGTIFHTARWDTKYDYRGKRMALIGNGCSAAQVVPSVVKDVRHITQYARSQQWYHERPNRTFSGFEKFCFKYIPFWQRYHRFQIFSSSDALVTTYGPSEESVKLREATEKAAKKYIYETAPKKYHDVLVPKFPLGCKRRIFDPGYLKALHEPNLTLCAEGIQKFDATGIVSESGVHEDFDVVVLATGFEVSSFLGPLKVVGKDNIDLHKQWDAHVGAQAYMGMYIHNFPNFALMFGPNTFPAHNSVIFASEVQVDYLAQTLFEPLIDGRARTIEVKEAAEEEFVKGIDMELRDTVFSAGCSNWYINKAGRNSASWPGYAATFWRRTLFAKWKDFHLEGGSGIWVLKRAWRSVVGLLQSKLATLCYAASLGFLVKEQVLGSYVEEAVAYYLK